jgi:hypothetical protein
MISYILAVITTRYIYLFIHLHISNNQIDLSLAFYQSISNYLYETYQNNQTKYTLKNIIVNRFDLIALMRKKKKFTEQDPTKEWSNNVSLFSQIIGNLILPTIKLKR